MSELQTTYMQLGKDSEGNWALRVEQDLDDSDIAALYSLVYRWVGSARLQIQEGLASKEAASEPEATSTDEPVLDG